MKEKNSYTTFWRIRVKQKLIDYKGGRCEECGYDKDSPSAYDFHHRIPSEKSFSISRYTRLKFESLKEEVDKCTLLCCRCHAELHDLERKDIRKKAFKLHENWINKRKIDK